MNELNNIALNQLSVAEQVADALMQLIVSGTLRAGQPLRESSLSQQLGVSRNSLREGIRLLEQSRLVSYEKHRGAIVSNPTTDDIDDLYRTRLHLELAAAAVEITPEQELHLKLALENLRVSTETNDAAQIVSADLRLHQAIVALLGSERLNAFYEQICKELVFYFAIRSYIDEEYKNPREAIFDVHEQIVHSICEGEHGRAQQILTEHIEKNAARLREIILARNE